MRDSGGRRHTRGSGNPVGSDLHRATAGNRGTVGGAMSLICGVFKGDRVLRRGAEEKGVVAPRGDRKTHRFTLVELHEAERRRSFGGEMGM